jgi:hypothetical protein
MQRSVPVKNATGDVTQCPCNDNADQTGFMIFCEGDGCGVWQHGACIGLTEKTVPEQYLCEKCDRDNPIHVAFRKRWGDAAPSKQGGKAKKSKVKKAKGDDATSAAAALAAAAAAATAEAPERRRPGRLAEREKSIELAAASMPAPPSTAASVAPASNKRKRAPEDGSGAGAAVSSTGASGAAAGATGATPKQPRSKKAASEAALLQQQHATVAGVEAATSPEGVKRQRLEDAQSQQQQYAQSLAQPPSHRASSVSASSTSLPSAPSGLSASSSSFAASGHITPPDTLSSHPQHSHDSAALSSAAGAGGVTPSGGAGAGDLSSLYDLGGADIGEAGSREARKIQRYISMIQKMEEKSKGAAPGGHAGASATHTVGATTAGGKDGAQQHGAEGDEDAEMAAGEQQILDGEHAQASSSSAPGQQQQSQQAGVSQALSQVYNSSAARMARAKLRAEMRTEEHDGGNETGGGGSGGGGGGAHPSAKSAKRPGRKKKDTEEAPALTAAEIRVLRLTASSQLRPLGPMYFGRKQFVLQSYRDETLRCETGWAAPLQQELPVNKRIVANWRYTRDSSTNAVSSSPQLKHHHHHPGHPSSIFPAAHPWASLQAKVSKAKHTLAAVPNAASSAWSVATPPSVQPDSAATTAAKEAAPVPTPAEARSSLGADKMVDDGDDEHEHDASAAGEDGVKLESGVGSGESSAAEAAAFLRTIDTTALPAKIQSLIHSFSSARASSALAAVSQAHHRTHEAFVANQQQQTQQSQQQEQRQQTQPTQEEQLTETQSLPTSQSQQPQSQQQLSDQQQPPADDAAPMEDDVPLADDPSVGQLAAAASSTLVKTEDAPEVAVVAPVPEPSVKLEESPATEVQAQAVVPAEAAAAEADAVENKEAPAAAVAAAASPVDEQSSATAADIKADVTPPVETKAEPAEAAIASGDESAAMDTSSHARPQTEAVAQ